MYTEKCVKWYLCIRETSECIIGIFSLSLSLSLSFVSIFLKKSKCIFFLAVFKEKEKNEEEEEAMVVKNVSLVKQTLSYPNFATFY